MPRRIVNVKTEIMLAFHRKKRATWPELLKETGVSKGALSKYLTEMIKWGIVETDFDQTVRPALTIYHLATTKAGAAMDYLFVPIKDKLDDFKRHLKNVIKLDKRDQQDAFNRVFALIFFNVLADHLTCFEAAIGAYKRSKSTQEGADSYSYFWHSYFGQTAKAVFELLISEPEIEELFSKGVTEVMWIAQKARLGEETAGNVIQAVEELMTNLHVKKTT
jgi:hypothetical protein